MYQPAQTTNPQPVTLPQTPSPHRNIVPLVVVAIVAALVASLGTYFVMSSNQNKQPQMTNQQSKVTVQPSPIPSPTNPPTTLDTTNWKTYSSKAQGYSFKYPTLIASDELFLMESQSGGVELTNVKPPIPIGPDVKIPRNIYISISDNPKNLDAKAYVDEILHEKNQLKSGSNEYTSLADDPQFLASLKRESITVGGITGEKVIGLPARNTRIEIFVPYKSKMYTFILDPHETSGSSQDKEWEMYFYNILSTFKFTN